jgi:glucose/mannose-6-phosphate isomerase
VTPTQYLDTLGQWDAALAFPEQLHDAVDATLACGLQVPLPDGARHCVLLGTGASGTVCAAAVAYGQRHGRVPVAWATGPELPGATGEGTLVLALSASGDSEEVVEAAALAHEQGATVLAVTGGGALGGLADTWGAPRLAVANGPDRAVLGTALGSVLTVLSQLDVVDDAVPSLLEAAPRLARRRDAWKATGSAADEMARRIGRTIPLIYGAQGLGAVAASHWKRQCNEHVKTPAFWGAVPDAAFGEVSGWGQGGDITRQVMTLITLRHHGEHPLVARRFAFLIEQMDEVMADALEVWAEGGDDLGRFLDLVLFGDLVTLHLAGREQIDPGPVAAQP